MLSAFSVSTNIFLKVTEMKEIDEKYPKKLEVAILYDFVWLFWQVNHVENIFSDKIIRMKPTRGPVFPVWAHL